ncbi:MAG: hypothetical protein ACLFS1_00825 [Opitutales bacterium]
MKNKIALATAAMVASSSLATAEIVINDFLSFEGFVDMSYTHTDSDLNGSSNSFAVDQVEVNWLFDFDPVTAQIDFTHLGSDNHVFNQGTYVGTGTNTGVEQAFATYHMDGGSAVTAGMYGSMLGFDAFEPTGLYQYSTGYAFFSNAAGTPGYVQGVKYTYETDSSFFGISMQDYATGSGFAGPGTFGGGSSLNDGYGIEVAGSLILGEGLTWFAGGAYEDSDDGFAGDAYVLNTYLTYETGAWIFAGELIYNDMSPDGGVYTDGYSAQLMGNFAYSEQASVTGRVSFYDSDLGPGSDADGVAFTLAHGYAFTDNLFLVNEISYADEEVNGADDEILFGAVELIFSF